MKLTALALIALSSTASADPVPSTITITTTELVELQRATASTVEPVGRKIATTTPVVTKLKLAAGDVIRAVNGVPAYDLPTFSGSSVIYLDVVHAGQPALVRVFVFDNTKIDIDLDYVDFAHFTPVTNNGKTTGLLVDRAVSRAFDPGDVIRTVDGKPMTTGQAFVDALTAAAKKSADVKIAFERLDMKLDITATVQPGEQAELAEKMAKGIKKIDDTHYEIKKSLVDDILANPMAVAKGARVVPAMKDGKARGFKLYAIRPTSFYALIGLTNGDTLVSVNGLDLTTADKALEVYTKIRDAKKLEVVIERRGKPLTLTYTIR